MATYINVFLKTEITVIPRILDKYIGKYYNNTLCNGATWMFVLWYILHVIFDDLFNALLKKMKYKEYIRTRLKRSLWYLGFYSTACTYCIAILCQNNIEFYSEKPIDNANTSSDRLLLGFIILSTFYLHSAFWESLKYHHRVLATHYFCLFLLLYFSYFLRFIEGAFKLNILICYTQIVFELTRCSVILINKGQELNRKINCRLFMVFSIFVFIMNYLVIIKCFLYPLLKQISQSTAVLAFFLAIWLILEQYDSVLFRAIVHWLKHKNEFDCEKDFFECALFEPRNDDTYNFLILRKEIKEREEKCLALRRPKNRNVIIQTLKCMVAIKRKLSEKRHASNALKGKNTTASLEDMGQNVDNDEGVSKESNVQNHNVNDITRLELIEDSDKDNVENLNRSITKSQLKERAIDEVEEEAVNTEKIDDDPNGSTEEVESKKYTEKSIED